LEPNARQVLLKTWKILGIKRIWLAKKAGIDRSKLSRWENGRAGGELTDDEILALSRATDEVVAERAMAGRFTPSKENPASTDAIESGKAIATLRRLYGITQADLASRARISLASLSLFENGYTDLDRPAAKGLERAINAMVKEKQMARARFVPLNSLAGEVVPLRNLAKPLLSPEQKRIAELEESIRAKDALAKIKDRLIELHREHIQVLDELVEAYQGLTAEQKEELAEFARRNAEYCDLLGLEAKAGIAIHERDEAKEKAVAALTNSKRQGKPQEEE
jgi:transcriptional regulator with XRE-family HTH domain